MSTLAAPACLEQPPATPTTPDRYDSPIPYERPGGANSKPKHTLPGRALWIGFVTVVFLQLAQYTLPTRFSPAVLTLAWVGLGIWLLNTLISGRSALQRVTTNVFTLGVVSVSIVSVFRQGQSSSFVLVGLCACLVACHAERARPGVVKVALALSTLPVFMYAILQWAGLDWNLWQEGELSRVHAGVGTANHLASLSVLAWMAILTPMSGIGKRLRWAIGLLAIAAMIVTQSRSGLVVMALSTCLFVFTRRFHGNEGRMHRLIIGAVLSMALTGIVFAGFSAVNERFSAGNLLLDGSVAARFDLLQYLPDLSVGTWWLAGSEQIGIQAPATLDNFALDLVTHFGFLAFLPALALLWFLPLARAQSNIPPTNSPTDNPEYVWVLAPFLLSALPHAFTYLNGVLLWVLFGALAANLDLLRLARIDLKTAGGAQAKLAGVTVASGLLVTIALRLSPLRAPDSPGLFPYPDLSPLPVWRTFVVSPAEVALFAGVLAASAIVAIAGFAMFLTASRKP